MGSEGGGDISWEALRELVDRLRTTAPPPHDAALERVLRALDAAHAGMEQRLEMLRYLYVTSIRLLEARRPAEVVEVIVEVLENLIGAETFMVLRWPEGERWSRIAARRGTPPDSPDVAEAIRGDGPRTFCDATGRHRAAVAPIRHGGQQVGAIVVGDLVAQKKGLFSDMDLELLRLLSAQAGPALAGAGQLAHAETERKVMRDLVAQPATDDEVLRGELDESMLAQVVQLIAMIRRTGRLVLEGPKATAELHFHQGQAVAVFDQGVQQQLGRGAEVLCAWLDRSGTFKFFVVPVPGGKEALDVDALLLECMRLHDEGAVGRGREWSIEAG